MRESRANGTEKSAGDVLLKGLLPLGREAEQVDLRLELLLGAAAADVAVDARRGRRVDEVLPVRVDRREFLHQLRRAAQLVLLVVVLRQSELAQAKERGLHRLPELLL